MSHPKPININTKNVITISKKRGIEESFTLTNDIIELSELALDLSLDSKQNEILLKLNNSAKLLLGIINDILEYPQMKSIDIDFNFLKKNLGSSELIDRLLVKFLVQLSGEFAGIGKAILNMEDNAPKQIHTLKGISGNLGATRLFEICTKIDKIYKNNSMVQSDTIEELQSAMEHLRLKLSKLYSTKEGLLTKKKSEKEFFNIKNPLKRATILIVDDSSANIEILASLLNDSYNIKIAKNGAKALALLHSINIDLILLDVIMPEMDGYEVCKRIKNDEDTKSIPIVFITSNDTPQDEEHGLLLGAVDYIKKPFHPSIVKMRVQTHINIKLKSDMYQQLSLFDGLTHIANRRSFDNGFDKLFKETQREKESLVVMMIDIDYFKPYNDNYGHGKGDETLIKVAAALSSCVSRPSDIVARYGGEEFVVVLKDVKPEGAKKVAQNLVESIVALHIEHAYSKTAPFITISIGIAYTIQQSILEKEKLLEAADTALYVAKKSGKNRFEFTELHKDD